MKAEDTKYSDRRQAYRGKIISFTEENELPQVFFKIVYAGLASVTTWFITKDNSRCLYTNIFVKHVAPSLKSSHSLPTLIRRALVSLVKRYRPSAFSLLQARVAPETGISPLRHADIQVMAEAASNYKDRSGFFSFAMITRYPFEGLD